MKGLPVWIVGGDSRIGGALAARLAAAGASVTGTSRRPYHHGAASGEDGCADRTALDLGSDLSGFAPPADVGVAVLCAAMTRQQDCRRNPGHSRRINVTGTLQAARAFRRNGTFVVFLSTNLVFDGTRAFEREDSPPQPRSLYGSQKAEVEAALLEGGGAAVVRLTKVVPPDFPLFAGWAAELAAGRPVRAFDDMTIAPVTLDGVAEALVRLCRSPQNGVYHLSGAEDVSYAAIARRLAVRAGASPTLVTGTSWQEVGREGTPGTAPDPAEVPAFTSLNMTTATARLGVRPTPLETVLDSLAPPRPVPGPGNGGS